MAADLLQTPLGIVLVHGYQKIDPELVLPTMRSAVEQQLNLIALGKADFHAVLAHALNIFKSKFAYFVTSICGMDELFEVSFTPLKESGKPLSRCGKCNRFMKYVTAKPCRLYCGHCDDTYSLPQNGSIKLYKSLKCPLDEFELVPVVNGGQRQEYACVPLLLQPPPISQHAQRDGLQCMHTPNMPTVC